MTITNWLKQTAVPAFHEVSFVAALLITCALYFPGLNGSFFFDDYPNIVENIYLHVTSLRWLDWLQAIWSSPASDLQRPLATLSFALNYFASGLDPWPMKAVNLLIHTINGCLLYLLLARVIASLKSGQPTSRDRWLVVIVVAAWLLHPINLTAVLYVIQRMESLAQVFVLAGLLLYVCARQRLQAKRSGAYWQLWVGFPVMLLLGSLSKESTVLLSIYALVLELTLPAINRSSKEKQAAIAFFFVFLIIPAIIGLTCVLPHFLSSSAYSGRPFTLAQRLLTEPRVLVDYMSWILLPVPAFFSFYHDDIAISTSLLSPWTTLLSILFLLSLVILGVRVRRSRPLATLGIFWFLAAHLITATVIPLELVFEHRNYFASAGLLLASIDFVLPDGNVQILPLAKKCLIAGFIGLCCFTLFMRAREWSNPYSLALAEVNSRPDSPRATYEYGRTLVVLSRYQADSPFIPKAFAALSRAVAAKGSGIAPYVAMILLASRSGKDVDPHWLDDMRDKLAAAPPNASDDAALKDLTLCMKQGRCALDDEAMLQVYLAAVHNGSGSPASLYSYAIFAYGRLHDEKLALQLAREAASKSSSPQYRLNLVEFLISLGMTHEASEQLAILKKQDRFGRITQQIRRTEQQLEVTN